MLDAAFLLAIAALYGVTHALVVGLAKLEVKR